MNEAFEEILDRLDLIQNKAFNVKNEDVSMYAIGMIQKAKKIVQEVAEEYNDDWISCSERLPDIEVDVLLTLRNLDIYTGFKANTDGYFYIDGVEGEYVPFDDIIAWKPLPKPYIEK